MLRKTIVLGMLGTTLDHGFASNRWDRWRPTVCLGQHDDLRIDRIELLHSAHHQKLADLVTADLLQVSPETEVNSHLFEVKNAWDFEEVYAALFDFSKIYPFDPENNDYLVHITTGTHVVQICLFLLTESRHIPAKLIQTSPDSKKNGKPSGTYSVIDLDLSRYDRIAERFLHQAKADTSFLKSGIDTRNPAFNAMIDRIEQVGAESTEPILLMGPTGAGKSRLARLVYELRKKRRLVPGDFVAVNCATLRGDAAMSALFGHKKGAFTGAAAERTGLLRQADKGVLFLDEVGELGMDEQAMLLHAIEEKCFYPMGSDTQTKSEFQLICGTNRPLEELAGHGRFREDLLARINLWTFRLPGLCERPEDIEPNLDYELDVFAQRTGKRVRFNREARELFLELATGSSAMWRGNFRDLSAAVMRMATLAGESRITASLVRAEWEHLLHTWRKLSGEKERDTRDGMLHVVLGDRADDLDLFDRAQLACVLDECRKARTLSEAGRRLFANSRKMKQKPNDADRLRKYLAGFGLHWDYVKRV